MAKYELIGWKDHVVSPENTYRQVTNPDGTVTQTQVGTVVQQGTPQSATNFRHMDEALAEHINTIGNPHDARPEDILLIAGGEGQIASMERTTAGVPIPARLEVLAKITEPEGDKSPDNPGRMERTAEVVASHCGANFANADAMLAINGITKNGTEYYIPAHQGTYAALHSTIRLWVNKTKTRRRFVLRYKYRHTNNSQGAFVEIRYVDGAHEKVQPYSETYKDVEFISSPDKAIDYVWVSYGTSSGETYLKDISLTPLDADKDFVPYTGQDITIPIGQEVGGLEGAPDYVDFARKVLVLQCYTKVFDGTEGFGPPHSASDGYQAYNFVDANMPPLVKNTQIAWSTHYLVGNAYSGAKPCFTVFNESTSPTTRLMFRSDITTAADFKAQLAALYAAGTPVVVIAELATPIEIPLSDAAIALIEQFVSNAGEMHVWSDGGGKTYVDRVTLADILGDVYDLRAELNELLAASGGA